MILSFVLSRIKQGCCIEMIWCGDTFLVDPDQTMKRLTRILTKFYLDMVVSRIQSRLMLEEIEILK